MPTLKNMKGPIPLFFFSFFFPYRSPPSTGTVGVGGPYPPPPGQVRTPPYGRGAYPPLRDRSENHPYGRGPYPLLRDMSFTDHPHGPPPTGGVRTPPYGTGP